MMMTDQPERVGRSVGRTLNGRSVEPKKENPHTHTHTCTQRATWVRVNSQASRTRGARQGGSNNRHLACEVQAGAGLIHFPLLNTGREGVCVILPAPGGELHRK